MVDNTEILIVDDTPEHIAFEGSILKDEGYKVYAVTNGKLALKFLENRIPDLIILDIKMDGMDGFEVCKKIKSNKYTKNIPIIFLTAEYNPQTIKKCFEVGGCDYVSKPFIREEYLARVKARIEISHKNQELINANNELKLFCSAVSHDLKSPLNVINMLIDTLKNELGEKQSTDVLSITDMISNKSNQLITMIDKLLEFSKMCNINPEMETLDLNAIISETFEELHSLEPNRNIQLLIENLPKISADDVLVRILIKNILSNSFKFTRYKPLAEISVTVIPNDDYIVISIKDNGVGFDMAYSDKLFKIFQRLHLSSEFEGTGVGLALVERIMKRHKGKIEAIGKVDIGTEILLYFPK